MPNKSSFGLAQASVTGGILLWTSVVLFQRPPIMDGLTAFPAYCRGLYDMVPSSTSSMLL